MYWRKHPCINECVLVYFGHYAIHIEMTYPCWRHPMDTFSALLVICAGNSPVTGEFPAQRPVTRGFDVFCDLCLNKRLSKQSWGWRFEPPSRSLWRQCNAYRDDISLCVYASQIALNQVIMYPYSIDIALTISIGWYWTLCLFFVLW